MKAGGLCRSSQHSPSHHLDARDGRTGRHLSPHFLLSPTGSSTSAVGRMTLASLFQVSALRRPTSPLGTPAGACCSFQPPCADRPPGRGPLALFVHGPICWVLAHTGSWQAWGEEGGIRRLSSCRPRCRARAWVDGFRKSNLSGVHPPPRVHCLLFAHDDVQRFVDAKSRGNLLIETKADNLSLRPSLSYNGNAWPKYTCSYPAP
ncbi:hypothetical protein EV126DRAFT_206979 [Verticillium dahliae]|nr:hypothetical protein EV126DRAFT_206979 [Verticillium dahliae]